MIEFSETIKSKLQALAKENRSAAELILSIVVRHIEEEAGLCFIPGIKDPEIVLNEIQYSGISKEGIQRISNTIDNKENYLKMFDLIAEVFINDCIRNIEKK